MNMTWALKNTKLKKSTLDHENEEKKQDRNEIGFAGNFSLNSFLLVF